MGPGTVFAWQHDARAHDGGTLISIFDNGGQPRVEPQSGALLIALDTKRMRATLQHRYIHNPSMHATHTGSVQLLANRDVLVGWGSEPYFTEYAPDGTVRFDAKLPKRGETYRVLRFPWVGRPTGPPNVVSKSSAAGPTVYASWNGATAVASWQLETGPSAHALVPALTKPRNGFETPLNLPDGATHAAVVALDASGKPLGRSATISL